MCIEKTCTKCGETKPLDGFYPKKGVKSALSAACRVCCRAAVDAFRKANPEVIAERQKAWHEKNRKLANAGRSSRYYRDHEGELARRKAWRDQNRETVNAWAAKAYTKNKARIKAWRDANKELLHAKAKAWREKNHASRAAAIKAWKEENRERIAAYNRANIAKKRAHTVAYREAKKSRTPTWADFEKILLVYERAESFRELGVDCHVDHIIPLRGKDVCGLHTHDNLQILLASDNLAKHNKVPDDPMSIEPTWRALCAA